ncbi:hypothetical protein AKO1_008809 [Acrasis kona]|uniref:Uncharacterized protein n=1 Tax=Acrasis kona TaxID=1008807 RepID=A0AAW2ZHQ4_9EUKA
MKKDFFQNSSFANQSYESFVDQFGFSEEERAEAMHNRDVFKIEYEIPKRIQSTSFQGVHDIDAEETLVLKEGKITGDGISLFNMDKHVLNSLKHDNYIDEDESDDDDDVEISYIPTAIKAETGSQTGAASIRNEEHISEVTAVEPFELDPNFDYDNIQLTKKLSIEEELELYHK